MLKILLSFLLISTYIIADNINNEEIADAKQVESLKESDLYLSYEVFPEKIYKNQVFSVSTKVLNTNKEELGISTSFGQYQGMKVLSLIPRREQKDFTFYDTYYFQATQSELRTPDLLYKLQRETDTVYEPAILPGKRVYALNLNANEDFSQVLANNFTIEAFKTTHYDQSSNIIVFTANTEFANIEDFNLSIASIQGFESVDSSLPFGSMTYYAVIPKHLRSLQFTYFNLQTHEYIPLVIPVEVNDDSVSTQMDLAPTQYTHSFAKIIIAVILISLGLILYLITRQKRYFFLIALTPILYVVWVYFPKEKLCIKPDAKIYLLPMKNSTIFQKYASVQKLQKIGSAGEYHKVLLPNLNIGWIKDEDLCED